MTKKLEGVPESFTREQYISLFQAVGLDPAQVLELNFRPDGVHAVVIAVDEQGQRIVTRDGYAKHTVFIPVDPKQESENV